MQLSQMQTLVSERLNEGASGPTFYPTSEITAGLNEANRIFCLLTLALEATVWWNAPAFLATAPFYRMSSYLPDWIVPLRITSLTGAKVCPAGMADLLARDGRFPFVTGSPTRYCSLGADVIGFDYPPLLGATLKVTYVQAPAPLVLATDTSAIPGEYHPRLVDYATYRPRQVEGGLEFQKSLKYFNSFLDGAQTYGNYVRSRNLGSRYDHVPFELDGFDRSALLRIRKDLPPQKKESDT